MTSRPRQPVAAHLDGLEEAKAREALHRCCASNAWVEAMLERRPFGEDAALFEAAEETWQRLDREDWLEAFAAHPRIGAWEARESATSGWSREEQSGMAAAADPVRRSLAEGNRIYEERFGHVFLIHAAGRSAEEMLTALRDRLRNDPAEELRVAADEQRKITRSRLEKLTAEAG